MKILEQALNKINAYKPQTKFLLALIKGFIGCVGKRTFRNLARYMGMDEHTLARQMSKELDFATINAELIRSVKNDGDIIMGVQDASFISKAGKSTHGVDDFWNGSQSKAEKGLELDTIGIVIIGKEKSQAYTLSAKQTPANPIPKAKRGKGKKSAAEPTRIDFYLDHLKEVAPTMLDLGVTHVATDAFYTKKKYVNGVVDLGLHVIGKLRKDARLDRVYTGPQKKRGRKKKKDVSKISSDDFKDSAVTIVVGQKIELRSCEAYSASIGRKIKIVWVTNLNNPNKLGEAYLFSTDTGLSALQIHTGYTARFQIEFIFRDAKGFTGLGDCQSRDAQRLNFHFNASLLALNVAKFEDHEMQKKENVQHAFSMTNWNRKYHVEIVISRFIAMFGLDLTSIKLHPDYEKVQSFGNVIH